MPALKSLIHHAIIELKSYIKVGMVGLVGAAIQFTAFNILRHFMLPQFTHAIGYANVILIATAIAIELAIISNFLLNNVFSFKQHKISRSSHGYRGIFKKAVQFNLVSLISFFIQLLIVRVGLHLFGYGHMLENVYQGLGIILGSLVNYLTYSRFIWKKKRTPH